MSALPHACVQVQREGGREREREREREGGGDQMLFHPISGVGRQGRVKSLPFFLCTALKRGMAMTGRQAG